jgi:hypothetical protein
VWLFFGRRAGRAFAFVIAGRSTGRPTALGAAATRDLAAASALSFRTGRYKFFVGQFAVVIFVERLEHDGGIGDFLFVNDAVVIGVERGDERRHRATRSFSVVALLGANATLLAARRRTVLCDCDERGHAECQRCKDECFLHGVSYGLIVVHLPVTNTTNVKESCPETEKIVKEV